MRKRMAACAALLGAAAALSGMVAGGSAAGASQPVPLPGNWEGRGPHGLPLSFSLAQRNGHLVATSIALGAPWACPATKRDAEAIALSEVAYAGPGASQATTAGAVLSGRVPGRSHISVLKGEFSSPRSGILSIHVKCSVGCGWPTRNLTWQVRRAPRIHLADGHRVVALVAPGITAGKVRALVSGHGRVLQSISTTFNCETDTESITGGFQLSPAYEFIRPNGRFLSPLSRNTIDGHAALWSGRLSRDGALRGTVSIFNPCTGQVVNGTFPPSALGR
jgi:hypothetical protein